MALDVTVTCEDLITLAEAMGYDPNNIYDPYKKVRDLLAKHSGLLYYKNKNFFYKQSEDKKSIVIASPCLSEFEIESFVLMKFEVLDNGIVKISFDDNDGQRIESYSWHDKDLALAMEYYGISISVFNNIVIGFRLDFLEI